MFDGLWDLCVNSNETDITEQNRQIDVCLGGSNKYNPIVQGARNWMHEKASKNNMFDFVKFIQWYDSKHLHWREMNFNSTDPCYSLAEVEKNMDRIMGMESRVQNETYTFSTCHKSQKFPRCVPRTRAEIY